MPPQISEVDLKSFFKKFMLCIKWNIYITNYDMPIPFQTRWIMDNSILPWALEQSTNAAKKVKTVFILQWAASQFHVYWTKTG